MKTFKNLAMVIVFLLAMMMSAPVLADERVSERIQQYIIRNGGSGKPYKSEQVDFDNDGIKETVEMYDSFKAYINLLVISNSAGKMMSQIILENKTFYKIAADKNTHNKILLLAVRYHLPEHSNALESYDINFYRFDYQKKNLIRYNSVKIFHQYSPKPETVIMDVFKEALDIISIGDKLKYIDGMLMFTATGDEPIVLSYGNLQGFKEKIITKDVNGDGQNDVIIKYQIFISYPAPNGSKKIGFWTKPLLSILDGKNFQFLFHWKDVQEERADPKTLFTKEQIKRYFSDDRDEHIPSMEEYDYKETENKIVRIDYFEMMDKHSIKYNFKIVNTFSWNTKRQKFLYASSEKIDAPNKQ